MSHTAWIVLAASLIALGLLAMGGSMIELLKTVS
jgi:hypothetical protein